MRILLKIILFPITLCLTVLLLFLRFVCAFSGALLSILSFIVFCIAVGTLVLLREPMSALHISIMAFVISPVGLPLFAE